MEGTRVSDGEVKQEGRVIKGEAEIRTLTVRVSSFQS